MKIQEYLEKLIKHLGVEDEFEIVLQETDDRLKVMISVDASEAALLIGNYGETLEALELLTKLSFKDSYRDKRIMLDINEYRSATEEKLKDEAIKVARRVLQTGKQEEIAGLNSYERYLIHSTLLEQSELSEVESISEDRDESRVLIIRSKKK